MLFGRRRSLAVPVPQDPVGEGHLRGLLGVGGGRRWRAVMRWLVGIISIGIVLNSMVISTEHQQVSKLDVA